MQRLAKITNPALKSYVIAAARRHRKEFTRRTQPLDVQSAAVLPSEMLAFIATCLEQEVDTIIESGRCNGYSTAFLGCYWEEFATLSMDIKPLADVDRKLAKKFPSLRLIAADGTEQVLPYVRRARENDRRVAVLLDGPKGRLAMRVMEDIEYDVVLTAIHDLHKIREKGEPNPSRVDVEQRGFRCFLTDDDDWTFEFGGMDEAAWRANYTSRESMTAFGLTLGIFPGGEWR